MNHAQRTFWLRLAASAFFVTLPAAWGVVNGLVSFGFAAGYAAVAGVGMLAIWDGARRPAAEHRGPTVLPRIAQTSGTFDRVPIGTGASSR